jgi:phosphoglycerate kinase
VIGGAKVSTKIGLLKNLIPRIDLLVIGGAMANTFLRQKGFGVGRSLVEDDYLQTAGNLLDKAAKQGVRVLLPVDVVVAPSLEEGASARVVPVGEVPADAMVFDVGPKTMAAIREALSTCRTIVWNGPMGVFETPPFHRATFELAEFLGRSEAFTVVGGGDSASAVDKAGAAEKVSYVSTGGGAFLEMLEGKTLPGVAALEECSRKS